jgi:hypothetical protein
MRSRANLQCWLSKLCLSLLILFIALSRLAAEGVILLRDYPSQSAKIWKPYAFSKVEQFPSAYKVTFASGQVKSCTPDEVGGILESPKWLELFAMSDADWEKIKKQRDDLAAKTAQLPQVKDWASDEIAKFDKLLNSRSSLNVLYRGRLIAKEDFDKLQGNTPPTPPSSSAVLTLDGKQFTNVKILSIKGGRLGFSHDGGIAGVQLSGLDTKQTEWVKAASPALFEAHLKELNMAGDKANQPSISQNKDAGSSKAIASKETETAKATGPNQPGVSQNKDTGSSKAIASKETETAKATEIIPQLSDAQKQAELSNRIRGLRLKVEGRAISNQYEMLKSNALSDGKEEDQAIRSQVGKTSTKDTSVRTGGMTPFSESKKGSSPLNLPRVENDMLSADQKRRLEDAARAFGKNPHEVIQDANELAKKIQHDMMYPEDRGLREREESRRKSGF